MTEEKKDIDPNESGSAHVTHMSDIPQVNSDAEGPRTVEQYSRREDKVGGVRLQRFTPRKPRSAWTELNKERCRRMERLGLMTDAGRAVIPDLDAHFVAEEEILAALQADPVAWANFQAFPALYQRVRIDNIQGYRHSASERDRLIARLVQTAHDGVMYGQWDDYGRLG